MIKIKYEEYTNDYVRKHLVKSFYTLSEFADWAFGLCSHNYSDPETGWVYMYWPKQASRVEIQQSRGMPNIWVHQIENDNGIMMSDGKYTAGQKYINEDILSFFAQCKKRQYAPKFNFV